VSGGARALFALILVGAPASAAAPPADYAAAREAMAQRDWVGAARLLRQAIATDPVERALDGAEPYLPQYWLGHALFELNNCLWALEAWRTSEAQGVVRATPRWEDLTRERGLCEQRVLDPAIRQASDDLAGVDGYLSLAEDLVRDPGLAEVWRRHPELADRLAAGRAGVASARELLDRARTDRDLKTVFSARDAAADAKLVLSRLTQEVVDLGHAAPGAGAPAAGGPRGAASTGDPQRATPTAADGGLVLLRRASDAYFAGRYLEASEAIASGSWSATSPRTAARARLLRAAALFSLARTAVGAADPLLAEARREAGAARRLDPRLSPDVSLFAPGFRALFAAAAP
jgi:hypothetical protein